MAEKVKSTIFIVEGKDDTARLRLAFGNQVQTIETGGSKISPAVLAMIDQASQQHELILLTDPDFQGERIRKIVSQRVPTIRQAFLQKSEGRPHHKGSLGVEHADPAILRKLLAQYVQQPAIESSPEITRADLSGLGLIDRQDSAVRRSKLTDKLHLGQTNGKQLLKRLNMFGITKKELKEAVENFD
ncbi:MULTISPECIES: ribonuclease M5 [Oenococcus]|uniref:Ribonuclease M5 n=1 Tax=Oenococcus kitaharae DSM 17330 TaxID=1045004 RepID=G9WER0_9LACO|nr:ribonuclease M5 [Oenococcus kitaharae]EHN58233.1 Ribonuclease M5 [Oenococcus kitaharae DSM 17330]OEY81580.1 ribonuclease M5 [Oenococcus kitaharae]OEY83066.1 ribonuclease M5 [Oenococcus kitaharae]OEY84388.1 ribonuclease M5 [Oenococcus kitaharae]